MQALIFDCDGVLADTERDGHRVAFNRAFAAEGLGLEWSVDRYGELLRTAGGKERLRRHFHETAWPVPVKERDDFIQSLHRLKTDLFTELVRSKALPVRSGVLRLMDEALSAGLKLAVCSTSSEESVRTIVRELLGPERGAYISVFAGDMVASKKPDPAIYNLAKNKLGLDSSRCVVIEDSNIGLRAALGAGLTCVVTTSTYTVKEDFTGAALIVPELGDGKANIIGLAECRQAVTNRGRVFE